MKNTYDYITILHLSAMAACLGAFVVQAARPETKRRWVVWVGVFGLACFGASVVEKAGNPQRAYDFDAFRAAGREMLEGRDPVDGLADSELPPLNPPSAYPLLCILAFPRLSVSFAVWTCVSAAMGFCLVRLTVATLVDKRTEPTQLSPQPFFCAHVVVLLVECTAQHVWRLASSPRSRPSRSSAHFG